MKEYIIITDDENKKHTFYSFREFVEYADSFTMSFLPDDFSYEIKNTQEIIESFKDGVADGLLHGTRNEDQANYYYKQGYDFGLTLFERCKENFDN